MTDVARYEANLLRFNSGKEQDSPREPNPSVACPPTIDEPYDGLLSLMLTDPKSILLPGNLVATWTATAASYRPADVPPAVFNATVLTPPVHVDRLNLAFTTTSGELQISDESGLTPGSEKGEITLEVTGQWNNETGFCIEITRKARIECDSSYEPPEEFAITSAKTRLEPCPYTPAARSAFTKTSPVPAAKRKTPSVSHMHPCEVPAVTGPTHREWVDENAQREFKGTSMVDALQEAEDIAESIGHQLHLPLIEQPSVFAPLHQFIEKLQSSKKGGIMNEKSRKHELEMLLNTAGRLKSNLDVAEAAIHKKTSLNLYSLFKFDHDAIFLIAKIKGNLELFTAELFKRSRLDDEFELLKDQLGRLDCR